MSELKRIVAYVTAETYERMEHYAKEFPETVGMSAWIRHVLSGKLRELDKRRERYERKRAKIGKGYYPSCGWPKEVACPVNAAHDGSRSPYHDPTLCGPRDRIEMLWELACFGREDETDPLSDKVLQVNAEVYRRGSQKINEVTGAEIETSAAAALQRLNAARDRLVEEIERDRAKAAERLAAAREDRSAEDAADGGLGSFLAAEGACERCGLELEECHCAEVCEVCGERWGRHTGARRDHCRSLIAKVEAGAKHDGRAGSGGGA